MPPPFRVDRRGALIVIASAAGGAALLDLCALTGCAKGSADPPGTVRLALGSLAAGERRRVVVGTTPVEVRRTTAGVEARSLVCTHWGCTVKWDAQRKLYLCPCHAGRYDADGNVVSGPPQKPLASFPVAIENDVAVLRPPAGPG